MSLQHASIANEYFHLILGLDMCEQFMDISDVIRDEDLIAYKSDIHPYGIDHRVFTSHSVHNIQKMVANMVPSVKSSWPSARERNLLKRKAKKDQTKGWCEDGSTEATLAPNVISRGSYSDSINSNKVMYYFLLFDSSYVLDVVYDDFILL